MIFHKSLNEEIATTPSQNRFCYSFHSNLLTK